MQRHPDENSKEEMNDDQVWSRMDWLTFRCAPYERSIGVTILGPVEAPMTPIRGTEDYRVIGVGLNMLFQVLRTFEGFATEFAAMRLQRNMDPNMRGDVITFDHMDPTGTPHALEVEVVGTFATDMCLADMILGGGNISFAPPL